jgi:hypothetical protein
LWDDRVFQLQKPLPKKEHSAQGRAYGEEADYHAGQRAAWIAKCAPLKEGSMKAFRECFQQERQQALGERRRRFDEVEARLKTTEPG